MFSSLCVITISVLFSENFIIYSCKSASVFGSIFDDASSKQIISVSRKITRRKFTICFSPFERFSPLYSIPKSNSSDTVIFYSTSICLPIFFDLVLCCYPLFSYSLIYLTCRFVAFIF